MVNFSTLAVSTLATLAAASPLAHKARQTTSTSNYLTVIQPTLSTWDSTVGKVTSPAYSGIVQRRAHADEFSTLFTFAVPSQYAGKTCALFFTLRSSDPNASLAGTGSGLMQLFTDSQPARGGATSDFRNTQLGTVKAVYNGNGVFGDASGTLSGNTSLQIPCNTLIQNGNLELAPIGDDITITFGGGGGLQLGVLSS